MVIPHLVHQAAELAERTIAIRQEEDRATGIALAREATQECFLIAENSGLSPEQTERAAVAAWLYFTALQQGALFTPEQGDQPLSEGILAELGLGPDHRAQIQSAVAAAIISEPADLFEEVVCDAVNSIILKAERLTDFSQKEMLLHKVVAGGKVGWLRLLNEQLNRLRFYTDYGQSKMGHKKDRILSKLGVYEKAMRKEYQENLMREFNLNKDDLKKLKKLGQRDDRGIQTLFRLTSRNHFTLNAMVDRKANIMISINAIILSVMISGLVGSISGAWDVHTLPILILTLSSVLSIIFAVISIRPEISHGEFTKEEMHSQKGNLLFYGNFLKMQLKDYEHEMLKLLNDRNYLYLSIIRDIYYLGITLNNKNRLLRISLTFFMVGIILAVVLFAITELT